MCYTLRHCEEAVPYCYTPRHCEEAVPYVLRRGTLSGTAVSCSWYSSVVDLKH